MLAGTAIEDVLIAFPLFGPAIGEFLRLRQDYPGRSLSVLVNNLTSAKALSENADGKINVFIDVDPGMRRTGVTFGDRLVCLAKQVSELPNLKVWGLHVYDGNVHHPNAYAVSGYSESLMKEIDKSIRALNDISEIKEVVTSSSLTAKSNTQAHRKGGYPWAHTVSPGTSVLWDSNYNDISPGEYDYASAIATRIIDVVPNGSGHIVTTDCGTKFGQASTAARFTFSLIKAIVSVLVMSAMVCCAGSEPTEKQASESTTIWPMRQARSC